MTPFTMFFEEMEEETILLLKLNVDLVFLRVG